MHHEADDSRVICSVLSLLIVGGLASVVLIFAMYR